MKTKITILILLIGFGPVTLRGVDNVQQPLITSETNAPRPGDFIEKLELQPVSVSQSGDSLIWDLSGHKTGPKCQIRYRQISDGKIIENESSIVKYYELRNDTLYLTRHGQAGMSIIYQVPESVVTYPMNYGSSQSGFFYGEGNLGNINYIRNAGYSTTGIDSRGILVTPDGDTIRNVLRSHYTRIGTTHTDDNFRQSFMSTRDSSLFRADSIQHWLSTDSITHRIERWRWYAPGYRYPIAEAETYKIYYYATPIDSVNRYYYYRAVDQEYDIEDDYANEQIRYNSSSEQWYADNSSTNGYPDSDFRNNSGGNSTNSNKGGSSTGKSLSTSGGESRDKIFSDDSPLTNYPYSSVSPTIVTGSTTVRYGNNIVADVIITLHNTASGVMWQYNDKSKSGDHSVICPMDAFPAGDYLIVTRIGDEVFTAKLIKR